jgi:hypothetical protein
MLDLARLQDFDIALAVLARPVPGLTRDLQRTHEAPDQVRGGVVSLCEAVPA